MYNACAYSFPLRERCQPHKTSLPVTVGSKFPGLGAESGIHSHRNIQPSQRQLVLPTLFKLVFPNSANFTVIFHYIFFSLSLSHGNIQHTWNAVRSFQTYLTYLGAEALCTAAFLCFHLLYRYLLLHRLYIPLTLWTCCYHPLPRPLNWASSNIAYISEWTVYVVLLLFFVFSSVQSSFVVPFTSDLRIKSLRTCSDHPMPLTLDLGCTVNFPLFPAWYRRHYFIICCKLTYKLLTTF